MRNRSCQFAIFISALFAVSGAWALPSPTDIGAKQKPAAPAGETDQARSQTTRPSTVVVIDAGHGGFDRGGIPGQRIAEKTMTLDVAERLRNILEKSGYRVVMTRDSDVFVPLFTRVAIGNSYPNAIFVCIHFNSARSMGANGIETYFYSRESLPLASAIHYYVAGGAPTLNRGVRRRGFYVLRRTKIPAVLVECGFLTNPSEGQYAQTVSYRQKLAAEIAQGIRARSTVASTSAGSTQLAADTIPLQPYIDQTRISKSSSKHSAKRTRSKSSKRKKSSASSAHAAPANSED
jgi:N-acetylmuramoyl-L-alanine amidase